VETPAIPAPVSAYAPEFARRLGIIFRMLAAIVARRLAREPHFIALVGPLWRRINRATRRFERLMAGLAAGRLPKPSRSGHGGPRQPNPLPRGRGWLVRVLGYEAAGCASQLQALLAEPEAAGLLAFVPAAARIIRPVGRMLDPGARNRPLRAIQAAAIPAAATQYRALPPALSPEWGRPRATEPWHRHHIVRGKPA
jgi:hypothetical protein